MLDTVLYLYGPDQSLLATSDNGIDPDTGYRGLDSSIIQRLGSNGTYYARVESKDGSSVGSYQLELLFSPEGSSGDIGDTLGTAVTANVSSGRAYSQTSSLGDRGGMNDVDIFRLNVPADVILRIDTDAEERGSDVDTVLRLFDASGRELALNDDGTDPDSGYQGRDSHLEFSVETPGTYYVGVSSYRNLEYIPTQLNSGIGGSQGEYNINISFDDGLAPPTSGELPEQVVWLNFDGGTFIHFNGVAQSIPPLRASDFQFSSSQRQLLIDKVVEFVRDDFITSGAHDSPSIPLCRRQLKMPGCRDP